MKLDNSNSVNRQEFILSALDQFERPLTAFATRLSGGNIDCARDAVQHTFMQLCKQPPGSVARKLAPWLFTVCRNRVLDELKTNRRHSATNPRDFDEVDPNADDPATRAEQVDFLRCLKKLMGQLSPSERDVIELWSHGFNTKEISGILGQQNGTVRVNLHRAIQKLRKRPEIANWLERATGQVVRPDVDRPSARSTSNCNETSARTITGKRS